MEGYGFYEIILIFLCPLNLYVVVTSNYWNVRYWVAYNVEYLRKTGFEIHLAQN